MPRLTRLAAVALAVTGFFLLAPRASADVIDTLDLTYSGGGNGQNGGGAFNWTQKSPPNSNFASTFQTYCIDRSVPIRSGTFTTHTDLSKAPTIGNDATKIAAINTLYDHFYSSSLLTSTKQAAFQAALWKLVYGSGYSIDTTTAYGQLAVKMLNGTAYDGVEHDLANAHLVVLVSSDLTKPRNQDQILVVPNPPTKPVPAPPAVMLAGIGALALFGRARLFGRKQATA